MGFLRRKNKTPLGIYIHVPFCRSKCQYCDFYSLPRSEELFARYKAALIAHIGESGARLKECRVDTVYFGGGTPSYFGADNIEDILSCLHRSFKIEKDAEITVEANPDSLNRQATRSLLKAGVNRISLGVQCGDDAMLKKIGTLSRVDIEEFFGCKCSLKIWVKVKEGWRNNPASIRNFGLDLK